MGSRDQDELDLGINPQPGTPPSPKRSLSISAHNQQALSPAQIEFNKRMKALEKERANHERQRKRLDRELAVCVTELMPRIEELNRAERDLIHASLKAKSSLKLTQKRQKWLDDLISGKAADLLNDPIGLNQEDIDFLEGLNQWADAHARMCRR